MKISNEVKYLGFNLMANLCNKKDVVRERNRFYNSFNSILRKFYSVDLDIFMVLMIYFCFNFFGIELWARDLNYSSIGCHKTLKKC